MDDDLCPLCGSVDCECDADDYRDEFDRLRAERDAALERVEEMTEAAMVGTADAEVFAGPNDRIASLEAELRNTGMYRVPPNDPGFVGYAYRGRPGEIVICGTPGEHSDHNCDLMGCGQCHVLYRLRDYPGEKGGE